MIESQITTLRVDENMTHREIINTLVNDGLVGMRRTDEAMYGDGTKWITVAIEVDDGTD